MASDDDIRKWLRESEHPSDPFSGSQLRQMRRFLLLSQGKPAPILPEIVHVHDRVGGVDGACYIGRQARGRKRSPFANPFKIEGEIDRFAAVHRYRNWLWNDGRELFRLIPDLRNEPVLECWCRHSGETPNQDNLCHGDVLVYLLRNHSDDVLRLHADHDGLLLYTKPTMEELINAL